MKASSDLERMGDHAVSIAKSTIRVKGETRVPQIEEDIAGMAEAVKEMVEQVLDAYVKEDSARARKIALEDHGINDFSSRIYKECIRQMQDNPETVIGSMDYMLVSSYLERIGDYVTNICEWIVYLKTGKITELNSNAIEDKFWENDALAGLQGWLKKIDIDCYFERGMIFTFVKIIPLLISHGWLTNI